MAYIHAYVIFYIYFIDYIPLHVYAHIFISTYMCMCVYKIIAFITILLVKSTYSHVDFLSGVFFLLGITSAFIQVSFGYFSPY